MVIIRHLAGIFALVMGLGLVSCATQVTEQPTETKRATIKFGTYKDIYILKSELAPAYAGQGPNIKAAKKIDEILQQRINTALGNVTYITPEKLSSISASQKGESLIIKPYIKQIKFIGGAARFWVGAMAGSSVVIMDAIFEDAATKEVIGKMGTYRRAGAYADPFGAGSNRMLEDAAIDISTYISANI